MSGSYNILSPPLQFTCSRTLKSLTTAFAATTDDLASGSTGKKDNMATESFDVLAKDVSAALRRFQHEQTIAIKRSVGVLL